jgi:GGDEF domain-containing protein
MIEDLFARSKPEEVYKLIFEDELTGALNRRAWDNDYPKALADGKHFAYMNVTGLKYISDTYSRDKGDALLKALVDMFKARGIDIYCMFDDCFAATFNNATEAADKLREVQARFRENEITVVRPDGTKINIKGCNFDYGHGQNKEEAYQAFRRTRADLVARGLRSERGEKPVGLVETAAENFQVEVKYFP